MRADKGLTGGSLRANLGMAKFIFWHITFRKSCIVAICSLSHNSCDPIRRYFQIENSYTKVELAMTA